MENGIPGPQGPGVLCWRRMARKRSLAAILASASVLGALTDHEKVEKTAAMMIAAIDIPLVILSHGGMVSAGEFPYFIGCPDELPHVDLDYWTMAFLGALFHFGIGWLVGYAAGLIRPPCVDRFGSIKAGRDRAPEDRSDPERASTER